jgi:ribosomal subunit interface protein
MQVTVKGKNTTVPEKLRARAERKLAKLQRFDDRILAMDVEFSEERNPRVADPHRVEVTLTTKAGLVRAHANATDPGAPRSAGPDQDGPVDDNKTDQAQVVYRPPDGDSGPDEQEP